MNREIKVRIWDKKKREMSYSDDYSCLGEFFTNHDYLHHSPTEPRDNYIKMEWTGLEDKNGHDIYEGDIVEANPWFRQDPALFMVKYSEAEGMYNPFGRHDYALRGDEVNVVGNKFKDDELLEEVEYD